MHTQNKQPQSAQSVKMAHVDNDLMVVQNANANSTSHVQLFPHGASSADIHAVDACDPIYIHARIDNVDVEMELDCGSQYSIVPHTLWQQVGQPHLVDGPLLFGFDKHPIHVIGAWEPTVTWRNESQKLHCVVADTRTHAICGREWISAFKMLGFSNVHAVTDTSSQIAELLRMHSELFNTELGKLKGVQAHIHVKPHTQYKQFTPRRVVYGMQPKIEKELDRLVKLDILEPVDTTPCGCAPIVPVLKPNDDCRICGNFKLTVNQYVDSQTYPIPRIDDVLHILSGGDKFSRIDVSDVYLQIELDEVSRKHVAIMTHKGPYQ
jgi:hypothetical protein